MDITQRLFEEASQLIETRYPTGWGGAAAMASEKGHIYTSVAPDIINAASALCIETGAILEAHKYNDAITHSICVVRSDEKSAFQVLTPCGICQERLLFWGNQIKVGVTNPSNELIYKALADIQPNHWLNAYSTEE